MKKRTRLVSSFLCIAMVAGMFISCDSEQSPMTDSTKLWPAVHQSNDGNIKIGYIDEKGDWVIQPIFDIGATFSDGVALVGRRNDSGEPTFFFVDKKGNQKGSFAYAEQHYCGLACASFDGERYGFVDASAEFKIQPVYESACYFSNDLAAVEDGSSEEFSFINKKGEIVLSALSLSMYDDISTIFSEGLAWCELNDKFGYINKEGKIAITPQFDEAFDFSDGLAIIEINERYGFIDEKGNTKIQPMYEDAGKFYDNGLAPVCQNGKWGYVNKKGEMKIQPVYDFAFPFWESLAIVIINGKGGVIDTNGNLVISPMFDGIENPFFHNGLLLVMNEGSDGNSVNFSYVNKKGETIWSATITHDDLYFAPQKALKKDKKSLKLTNHFTLDATSL